jgi:hypothetical protein
VFELKIIKSGNLYLFECNGDVFIKTYDDGIFQDALYAGIFTSRNVKVEYSNLNISKHATSSLTVASAPSKTAYLVNEDLELDGLVVKADGQTLSAGEYIVHGYDKTQAGVQDVSISYGGLTTTFQVEVKQLTCEELQLVPGPFKTTYYIGDEFSPLGMVVQATFNSGEVRNLSSDEYTISDVNLSTPGKKGVIVSYNGNSLGGAIAIFNIEVLADELTGLIVAKQPTKTVYYLGDELDARGLAIKAVYAGQEVLLSQSEFTIDASDFDTLTAGQKSITITHKNKSIEIPLLVKEREVLGIELTAYPTTTYEVGETFNSDGIEVSVKYDNGDKVVLDSGAYTIDVAGFDNSKAGTYAIGVIPLDATLAPISFNVTVVDPIAIEWKSIVFGQSISASRNFMEILEDGTVRLTALEGGGKITNSFQDGITYYYTELNNTEDNFELSADIKVIDFAKPTPDNQEGFGIMARDAIGTHLDSSVFYSNIAAVGGYRGVTQMVMRSGVTDSDSSGAATGVQLASILDNTRPTESNTYPVTNYRLTLKKTNTGYIGQLNNGEEVLYFEPDALGTQNDTLYVGFYAARLATIEVSNIDLKVTKTATDAPRVEAPKPAINPSFNFASLTTSSLRDYTVKLHSNVDGTVTIKQGDKIIVRDKEIKAGQIFEHLTTLDLNSTTPFTAVLTPSTDQDLTSYEQIVKTQYVTMKSYQAVGEPIYVSQTGKSTGDGSKEKPLDIQTAIDFVMPGQTIYLLEGTYNLTKAIGIQPGNDGTADAMKVLSAAPGAKVIIDGGKTVSGFNLDGDYWHIFGIDFARARSTGFRVGGNHNIVELCNFYENGDTGMQISRYGDGGFETWPSYNLVLNCTSYDNIDASENNADGFAAKLTVGDGNVFRGCIAHNNIDDAWDLFAKGSTGPIGAVLIEDCIAYENGMLTNGYVGAGDKNGFKLGGEGIAVPHTIRNSIAFNNLATGFSSNSNPAVVSENCVSYDNVGPNFDWRVYTDVTPQFVAKGNISYRSEKGPRDVYTSNLVSETNFYYNGTESVNSKGIVLTDSNFASLVAPEGYERDAQGNIIFGDFLKYIAPRTSRPHVPSQPSQPTTPATGGDASGTDKEEVKEKVEVVIQNKGNGKTPTVVEVPEKAAENMLKALANSKMKAVFKEQVAVQIAIEDGAGSEKFEELLSLSFNLADAALEELDTNKLTLVKYVEQADGTFKAIRVGGEYDSVTKTFEGLVEEEGNYGIAYAEDLKKVSLTIDKTDVKHNGQIKTLDVAPEIVQGATMVPLRFVAETLDAEVEWDAKAKEVTIEADGKVIVLKIGEIGEGMTQPAMIKNNRTLVPMRYIAESLDAYVLWVPSTKSIEIVK